MKQEQFLIECLIIPPIIEVRLRQNMISISELLEIVRKSVPRALQKL